MGYPLTSRDSLPYLSTLCGKTKLKKWSQGHKGFFMTVVGSQSSAESNAVVTARVMH